MTVFHILIVDDQVETRRVLRAGLETLEAEIRVVDVPSAEEALLVLSRQPVDLLVTDVRLAGISGLELHERARQRNPGLKVILITGLTDPLVRRRVAEAGADAFFIKPIDIAGFLDAVERSLGLVKSFFPPPPLLDEDEEKNAPASPLERLAALCRDLDAIAVSWLDADGKVRMLAGNLPPHLSEESLFSAYTATARAALGLPSGEENGILYFSGGAYDILVCRTGTSGLFVLVLKKSGLDGSLAGVYRALQQALPGLVASLQETGAMEPDRPGDLRDLQESDEIIVDEQVPPEFELLLGQAQDRLKPEEVDAFWDSLVESDAESPGEDNFSSEQARQLGFPPDDLDK